MKRALDIVIGGLLAALALPVLLALAVGLALTLRTWPFFSQTRIGLAGEPFRFIKLRTLPPSTPAYADKYELHGVDTPWFARQVRRLHLDELPQLFLVLSGRMSLVGPRPEMPNLHLELSDDFARARTSVRPGCTGLWQVGASVDRLIAESPEYDLAYVRFHNPLLDLWVLWRTVLVVAGLSAGVHLAQMPAWAHPRPMGVGVARRMAAGRGAATAVEELAA